MSDIIKKNLISVRKKMSDAAKACGRCADDVKLLAVSKTFSVECILEAIGAGQRCFGENYVDEATHKIKALSQQDIEWHFIGAIQSNKTRLIAAHFDWVHSVDREKIALRLQEQRSSNREPLNICIQVNIDQEPTKAGVLPEHVATLAAVVRGLDKLQLRGLMAIPKASADVTEQLVSFEKMATLYQELQQQGYPLDTLSMGMSADFRVAIQAGSTMIRVGTGIFGQRF